MSDEEQEARFQKRINNPTKRWKLSPMDLQSRARGVDYSRAKDAMPATCDFKASPWWVVPADNKKRSRLNCIAHVLSLFTYKDYTPKRLKLPPRQVDPTYTRPPVSIQSFVPQTY